ncbi:LAMI_0F00848g1_1 [Lachancea mirantina]|uniref:LAMI_0F00848g1_1 n=1 Tax=Lachancea mirantina TaxID=1230905 RepID=A0A1G4JVK2_9SACH|nr:LAMI_0F00848g1_1 [Lachancea mirantina]
MNFVDGRRSGMGRNQSDVPINDNDKDDSRTMKKDVMSAEDTMNGETDGKNKRPRKKRKTYSCELCRRFKTRCDFEPQVGKCYRCNILRLDCSLTVERENEIVAAVDTKPIGSGYGGSSRPLVGQEFSVITDDFDMRLDMSTLNNRLNKLENNIEQLDGKLDLLLMMFHGPDSSGKISLKTAKEAQGTTTGNRDDDDGDDGVNIEIPAVHAHVDRACSSVDSLDNMQLLDIRRKRLAKKYSHGLKLQEPPLKLIDDIDERLFPTKAESQEDKVAKTQRPFVVARSNFSSYYNQHEKLCHDLAREFLVKSHFWIIPGGIKEIKRDYVEKHLFITSVFTIIAMGFDENNKYEKQQEILYPLVERFLTNTLTMFENLTDHDIEAILYCCMFNISRKSKRHRQMKFNALVLCNFALNSVLNIVDYHKIKERVVEYEEYNPLDLYHLRILNSLTTCRMQYCIGYGCFTVSDDQLREFNNLTAKFPQANFGDDIKISEINLSEIVNDIYLDFKTYFKKFSANFRSSKAYHKLVSDLKVGSSPESVHERNLVSKATFFFPELDYWLKNWDELLLKDGGSVLLFAYNYYYIMICRSFITEFYDEFYDDTIYFRCTLKTMQSHSIELLDSFLKLSPSLIKGAPVITLHQLIYACLALCDFLHFFSASERQHILNLCTKIYWHLNTIGEKSSEATENVGKIIKSLIDTSKQRIHFGGRALPSKDRLHNNHLPRIHRQPSLAQSVSSQNSNKSSFYGTPNGSPHGGGFSMPDVDQFNTFEDFFQDFFDNLKPTIQNIFSTTNQGTG